MTEQTPEMLFASALAEVQAQLPQVRKESTATVPTKSGGSYSYKYADLADILTATLPVLNAAGFSWTAAPTVTEHGFVLRSSLLHTAGHREVSEYPLPNPQTGTPQAAGSAVTYARRYSFCALIGIAPDEDDDAQTATHKPASRRGTAPPAAAATGPQRTVQRAPRTDSETPPIPDDDQNSWPVPPEKPPAQTHGRPTKPVSEAQLRMMAAVFGQAGVTDRDERLSIVASVIDRDVDSAKDLTVAEASKVLDHMTKQVNA